MEKLLDPETYLQTLEPLKTWFMANILVLDNLAQIVYVVFVFFIARLLHKYLGNTIQTLSEAVKSNRIVLQAIEITRPLLFPLLWLLLVGAGQVTSLQAGWESGILGIGVSLLTAWVAIRLLLHFVVDPWIAKMVAIFVWTVAALDIVGILDPTLAFLDGMAIHIGELKLSLLNVMQALVTLAILLWLASAVSHVVENRLRGLRHLTPSQQVLFGKLSRVVLITLALLIGINALGIDLTALAVFSGAIGLGVGFGLQKVVSNLISGVILLMDRSVKPGDVIAINNTYGWINTIGARYVSVITRDGIEHLIPNEELISRPVENWSYSDRLVRQRLPVGVSYESDINLAMQLCVEASQGFARVLQNPEPRCLLKGFGDSSVDLELRVWIQDAEKGVSNIKSEIYLRIWELFHENNIQFPYPHRDVRMQGELNVRLPDGIKNP